MVTRSALPYGHRLLLSVCLAAALAACGGGDSGGPSENAAVETAPDPIPSTNPPPPTVEMEPAVAASRLFASGFESPVAIAPTNARGTVVQPISGGDIGTFDWADPLWGESGQHAIGIHSIVGESTPLPAHEYSRSDLLEVTGRTGEQTRALSLANIAASPATQVQQIALRRIGMTREPAFYQRLWLKFDPGTLARAETAGERDFYQIFWEIKAEPDFRIRLQLQYDAQSGLYWQAQADRLFNSVPLWSGVLDSVPVVLAPEGSADGWHRLEVWLDRMNNRFKAAVDGRDLVDRTGSLMGVSGNGINLLLPMIVYSDVAPLAGTLFDDFEIWSSPPSNAWR